MKSHYPIHGGRLNIEIVFNAISKAAFDSCMGNSSGLPTDFSGNEKLVHGKQKIWV